MPARHLMCLYAFPMFRFVPHHMLPNRPRKLTCSIVNGMNSSCGFCFGSHVLIDHRITSASPRALSPLQIRRAGGPHIRGQQHPSEHAVHPEHSAGVCVRYSGKAQLCRGSYFTLAHRLVDHTYPPTLCVAIVVFDPGYAEPHDHCSALATVVIYFQRSAC